MSLPEPGVYRLAIQVDDDGPSALTADVRAISEG